jgi:hypothetical protein
MEFSIIDEFGFIAILAMALSAFTAYLFYQIFIPRSLSGLQVAFPTGPKRYEVHTVTANKTEARQLLKTRGMRDGIIIYMMAFIGAILLGIEWMFIEFGISEGYHKISLGVALVFIVFPALISAGVSLSVQIMQPTASSRTSLQSSSSFRLGTSIVVTILWFSAVGITWFILSFAGTSWDRRIAIIGTMAFAPSFIAYGRILGSSWTALKESSHALSKGEPSAFYPFKPIARKQFVSNLVYFNAVIMPFIALNTVISLILLLINPDMFQHSQQVLNLPEYTVQTTIMEEGGVLGFYIIELFSYIGEAGIRVPLVSMLLLFLLLNIALVGFLFVYEVARILFLDIADVSGMGGIHIADSRLLRSEKSQQAKVLNFCFTGFAGQSMLLLALAMMTFWDSQFLPRPEQCGTWQNTVCGFVRKDALEEMTWMLASGGQIVFLVIWVMSRRTGQKLSDIQFDATANENRIKLEGIENLIYRQRRNFTTMVANDQWSKALQRMEKLYEDHGEESIEGLSLVKRTEASMELLSGLGRWDQAEQVALSFLALRAGRKAEIARLLLTAASLAQRDIPEAMPRLKLLATEDLEAARLCWAASIFDPSKKLPPQFEAILLVDPVTRRNIDLIKRYRDNESEPKIKWLDDSTGRLLVLGDLARMRSAGKGQLALEKFEQWIIKNDVDIETWPHGQTARAILYLDSKKMAEAVEIVKKTMDKYPRHPHLRRLAIQLAEKKEISMPAVEKTGLIWADTMIGEWEHNWVESHNVVPPPQIETALMKHHAWNANSWVVRGRMDKLVSGKKAWKKLDWVNPPLLNQLITTGLIITAGGMPIDLGFPGWIDIEACEKANLI